MTDPNFSAIRARLRYKSLDAFIDSYSRFISAGGMFVPMAPAKLKPVGTTIRFQFLLQDGTTAMLGEGVVRQIQGADKDDNSPVGMLVKFTKLSRETKDVVDAALARKEGSPPSTLAPDSEQLRAPSAPEQADQEQEAAEPEADPDGLFLAPEDSEEAVTEESDAEEVAAAAADASGSDVFSEASQADPAPAEQSSPDDTSEGGGPREIGRTEAGLQIMAFDEVGDEELADFDDFDFGGDGDEVDQAFDGIFGGGGGGGGGMFGGGDDDGGGMFGGGDDDGGGMFGDGGGENDGMFADVEPHAETAFDGGSEIEEESDAAQPQATDRSAAETYDLNEQVDVDEKPAEAAMDAAQTHDLDEAIELDDADIEEEEPGATFDLEEEIELDEEPELEEEVDLVEEPEFVEAAEEEASSAGEPEPAAQPEPAPEPEPAAQPEPAPEPEPAAQPEPAPEPEPATAPEPIQAGLSAESSAPSEDLLSALGSLDNEEEEELELTIGSGAEPAPEPVDEEEDEESLEALLAKAQQDIDKKRESEESDEQGDILDELLGGDDLPPPPSNDPVFDLSDSDAKKKKKGGFINKLFGKD